MIVKYSVTRTVLLCIIYSFKSFSFLRSDWIKPVRIIPLHFSPQITSNKQTDSNRIYFLELKGFLPIAWAADNNLSFLMYKINFERSSS